MISSSFVNATEDVEYLITTAELRKDSDLDASDQLSVESLVFKADNAGLATTEAAGALNLLVENGVVTGYRFTILDDYLEMLSHISFLMIMDGTNSLLQ